MAQTKKYYKNMILMTSYGFYFFSQTKFVYKKVTSKIKLYLSIACHAGSLNYMQKQQ